MPQFIQDMEAPCVKFDKQTDGDTLLDWVHDNNAVLKPDDGRWCVVHRDTGKVLGEGTKPSDAIVSAANSGRQVDYLAEFDQQG